MSTDHGPGAPSFGDLFEDPDSPAAPAEPAAPAAEPAAPAPAAPEASVAEPAPVEVAPVEVAPLAAPAPVPAGAPVDTPPLEPEPVSEPVAEAPAEHVSEPSPDVAAAVAGAVVVGAAVADHVAVPPVVVASGALAPEAWDGTVDPSVSSAPAGRVDTGRLYRSAGAEGPSTLDAIPAIDPSYAPGRRVEVVSDPVPSVAPAERGLTYSGVVVVVGAVTVLVAFAEALLRDQIGLATGVALLVSSLYCAVVVRRADIWAAVVVPPLAFLVAALTAGQLILDKSGSLVIREGFSLFRTLATNAPWILGTTALCLVVVLVRRYRIDRRS